MLRPDLRRPSVSAASIMVRAGRSLSEPEGFALSSLRKSRQGPRSIRVTSTRGVLPMRSSTDVMVIYSIAQPRQAVATLSFPSIRRAPCSPPRAAPWSRDSNPRHKRTTTAVFPPQRQPKPCKNVDLCALVAVCRATQRDMCRQAVLGRFHYPRLPREERGVGKSVHRPRGEGGEAEAQRRRRARARGGAKYADRLHAEVFRSYEKWRSRKRAEVTGGAAPSNDPWPQIYIRAGELPRVVNEAEDALLSLGREVYQRGGLIVRPVMLKLKAADNRETSGWRLIPVTRPWLVESLTCAARFLKYDGRS